MGETIEGLLDRQKRAGKEQYRRAVGQVWTDNKVDDAEADRLGALQSELGLNTTTAADIEREVTGDTVQAILQRQTREVEARQRHLDELYNQARRLYRDQDWRAVVDVFEQIHSVEPGYPDPEGLLEAAREVLERIDRIAASYDQGQRHMDAGEWQQALECLEKVERLEPGYRETQNLLSQVRQELAPPLPVEVPDLAGKSHDEARNMLDAAGLRQGTVVKVPSNEVAEDKIVEQYPAAGSRVERGTSVRISVAQKYTEDLTIEEPSRRQSYPKPDSLPDEPELRRQVEPSFQKSEGLPSERRPKSEKPQDLPD
jgi:tetratricopeptide (TPR) repeat protein